MIDMNMLLHKTEDMEDSYVIASGVDRLIVDRWPLQRYQAKDLDFTKLLEIRIFNQEKEIKWFRPDISVNDFTERMMNDSGDTFSEWQYLSIDTTDIKPEGNGNVVQSTTGVKYYLPIEKITKHTAIKICCEISYYSSGKAYVSDFRCVAFGDWQKENENGKKE